MPMPGYGWAWRFARANQAAEAQKAFEQALQINPNRVWAKQQLEKTPGS